MAYSTRESKSVSEFILAFNAFSEMGFVVSLEVFLIDKNSPRMLKPSIRLSLSKNKRNFFWRHGRDRVTTQSWYIPCSAVLGSSCFFSGVGSTFLISTGWELWRRNLGSSEADDTHNTPNNNQTTTFMTVLCSASLCQIIHSCRVNSLI